MPEQKSIEIKYKGKTRKVPEQYLKGLKGKERQAQIKSIFEGKDRPKTKAPTKRSSYTIRFEKKYGKKISDKKWIHQNLITNKGQELIIEKGMGAYYSSGSRPNQTPPSWGLARLASVILNGPARRIDKNIWDKYKR